MAWISLHPPLAFMLFGKAYTCLSVCAQEVCDCFCVLCRVGLGVGVSLKLIYEDRRLVSAICLASCCLTVSTRMYRMC